MMRLFTELKRRNVLRMAVLYTVAAWLVMQVAGVLMDLGVLPGEVGPWLMVVLTIGFPIALIASWFFEIAPEGIKVDADGDRFGQAHWPDRLGQAHWADRLGQAHSAANQDGYIWRLVIIARLAPSTMIGKRAMVRSSADCG